MKPSLASAWTYSSMVAATVSGVPMKFCRPVTSMITSRSERPFGRGELPPLGWRRRSDRVCIRTLARPRAMVFSPTSGSIVGQRPVRVVVAQVPVPQLLGELDRGLPADLLPAHLVRRTPAPPSRCRRARTWRPAAPAVRRGARPYFGQPALDVGVERLPGLQRAVPAEDRVGGRGGELPARVGVAGLEDHRAALRAARHVEVAVDVEVVVAHGEGTRAAARREERRRCPCRRRSRRRTTSRTASLAALQEALGPLVALLLRRGTRRGGSSRR